MEADLSALARLVANPAFRGKADAFMTKHMHEFATAAEDSENKLEWTLIHNEYQQLVDAELGTALGADAVQRLCEGMEAFLQEGAPQDPTVADAISVLQSMTDFRAFKMTMIMKLAEAGVASTGATALVSGREVAVVHMEGLQGQLTELLAGAADEGWTRHGELATIVCDMKEGPGGAAQTYVRHTVTLDLSLCEAKACMAGVDAFASGRPNLLQRFAPDERGVPTQHAKDHGAWHRQDHMPEMEAVRILGPDELVLKCKISVPWVVRYMMGLPSEFCVRVRYLFDFPSPSDYSNITAPYLEEEGVTVAAIGMIKTRCSTISAHPTDQRKSVFTQFEVQDYTGFKRMLKGAATQNGAGHLLLIQQKFKKHPIYARLQEEKPISDEELLRFMAMD